MKLINTYTLEVKKSKFIAHFYELDSKEEAEIIIDNLWKENKKARHIPYAYIYKGFAKKLMIKSQMVLQELHYIMHYLAKT